MNIKIGPQVFTIEYIKDLRGDEDQRLDGRIRFGLSKIILDSDLDQFSRHQVLWHEILHSIAQQSPVSKLSESLIDTLSFAIIGVLNENPWLINSDWTKKK